MADPQIDWRSNEYLLFQWAGSSASGKTSTWTVCAQRDGALLGLVSWFGRWHQYTFHPEPGAVFNDGCLLAIAAFCREMTVDQRRAAAHA